MVAIAEAVEWWRLVNYPDQWFVIPLIIFFTILALIVIVWLLLKKYKVKY